MATRAFLKALRKKYGLGEYSKRRKESARDQDAERARKRKKARRVRRGTANVRGRSRTPTITKYKRRIRKAVRKAPGKIFRKLGEMQGFPSDKLRLY